MKKYLFFDSAKCSACGACALACIDQNDVDVASGQQPFRHTFTLENKQGDLSFHSVSCMHCADAPCVTGCPRGCIERQRAGMLPACVKVCPTGALVLLTEDEFKARQAAE